MSPRLTIWRRLLTQTLWEYVSAREHYRGGESYKLPSKMTLERATFLWAVMFKRQINGSGRQRMMTSIMQQFAAGWLKIMIFS